LGIEEAMREILQGRGTLYEPQAVDVCVKLFSEGGFRFDE